MKTFLLALTTITTFQMCSGQTASNQQQDFSKPLPKEVIIELANNILTVKESDQYFTAELLEVFMRNTGASIEQAERKIENIANNREDQKLLFNYWHDYKFSSFSDPYTVMVVYFEDKLLMVGSNAIILAKYINQLDYLSSSEKKDKEAKDSVVVTPLPSRPSGSGIILKITKGDRKVISSSYFNNYIGNAHISTIIKVSPEGQGSFVSVDFKNSTSTNFAYPEVIIKYLQNVKFDESDHVSVINILFIFRMADD